MQLIQDILIFIYMSLYWSNTITSCQDKDRRDTYMKKKKRKVIMVLLTLIMFPLIFVILLMIFGNGKLVLPVEKKEVFELSIGDASYVQKLTVKDGIIVNEQEQQVVLQGLMVPEVRRLDQEGKFNKKYFEEVFACGGNVIRIPIHPEEWEQDEYYLWRYLDPIVEWAVENNKYIILDLHFIGNIESGIGDEMPKIETEPLAFSVEFWKLVAGYFKDVPNVIFEIYNEPAYIDNETWSQSAQLLVDTIRDTGAKQIIIVSGTDYSYDLSYWAKNPMQDSNIVYAAHIFPNRKQGLQALDEMSEDIPIIVTEWGYISKDEPIRQYYLVGERDDYGMPMLQLMERKGISWVACWYDDNWEPPMFFENSNEKTNWGEFILEKLSDDNYKLLNRR